MDSACTILLVDDDPTLLAVLAAVVRKSGYIVITADSGEQALNTLRTHSISAVITDLHMPKLNGVALLEQVAASGNDIPGILVTGSGSFDEEAYSKKPGVSAVLFKPIGGGTLIRTLERVLAQKKGGEPPPPR